MLDYYVPQHFLLKGNAIDAVYKWVNRHDAKPLAVLSTYGMGKTSLAQRLAYSFAENVLRDPTARIPIYIPLGQLSSQQRIDGLLGSLFTSAVTVRGYSFPLFQKMNALGHFILLLDGLDEMRHAMTWDDFQYNFDQISEIIPRKSKAILFGRPNIFKDQKEYDQIIGGRSLIGRSAVTTAVRSGFEAVDIKPFATVETATYLKRYMRYLLLTKEQLKNESQIERRVEEIKALQLGSLLSRPVHAKMLAELASDFRFRLAKITRYQLYQQFISYVLKRDFSRGGGKGLTPAKRRRYLRQLAWHFWFETEKSAFKFGDARDLLQLKEAENKRSSCRLNPCDEIWRKFLFCA